LEFAGGYFYASYSLGRIVRFGFKQGDEVNLGNSGFPGVEGLARRPDGRVFAVLSQNASDSGTDDVRSESLGELNLSNGHISIAAQPPQATVSGVGASFDTLAYIDNTNFYAVAEDGGFYGVPTCHIHLLSAAHPYFSPSGGPLLGNTTISWGLITGLVVDLKNNQMLGVTGYQAQPNLTMAEIPSVLYRLSFVNGSVPQDPIGPVGVNGIIGLTFGPDWPGGQSFYQIDDDLVAVM
jgi:hypothetical protein